MGGNEDGTGSSGGTTTYITTSKKFDVSSITKLTSKNFRVWKMRMTSLYEAHSAMGVVDGTEDRPAAAGESQKKWDNLSKEAFSAMLNAMTDDEVDKVSGCDCAQEVWKKLCLMYECSSGENKAILWSQFYSVFATDSPMNAMCEIQKYAAQLRSLGATVEDEQIVARVIHALHDDRYRYFREAWRSVPVTKQTAALLISRLKIWELEEGDSHSASTAKSETSSKAFKSGQANKKKKTKEEIEKLKQKTKCRTCGQKGHWKAECHKKDEQE